MDTKTSGNGQTGAMDEKLKEFFEKNPEIKGLVETHYASEIDRRVNQAVKTNKGKMQTQIDELNKKIEDLTKKPDTGNAEEKKTEGGSEIYEKMLAAFNEKFGTLEKSLNDLNTQKAIETRNQRILKALGKHGINETHANISKLVKMFEDNDDDPDFENQAAEIKTMLNHSLIKESAPGNPIKQGSDKVLPEVLAFINEKKAQNEKK